MEVRLFGQLEAVQDGVAVPVRGAKQRALLALLALQRGKPVSADRLIDHLWGDGEAGNPANALQAQIGQLRRSLGPAAIVTSEAGYALDIGPDDVDVVRFEQLVAAGRRLVEKGEASLASAAFGEALALRQGEPLAEFAYAGFADVERAHLDELTLVAIEARAGADLELGLHGDLVGALEALCREHPLRERLWELLILALYRAGRQAEALRAYTEARDRLVDELGIEPGPALRELQARVLAQDPALTPPGPARLRAAGPAATGNLRAQLSSFIGRDAELEQLCEAVRSHRLVTLIGPGGAGKTRLAVEAAGVLREEHRDRAWLIELAGVAEPGGVVPAAAVALGAGASAVAGREPAGSTVELIVRHLAGRSVVVVIDNCEHVIAQAAALADALMGSLPALRLITTSREPLGVPGEILVAVGGLAPPAAVELLVQRARAVRPGFTADDRTRPVIEEICRRPDGLPLAVELAAARLRALTLATVAQRLEDRFRLLTGGARTALPRQQSLRAVVDWSYDLLFEDERRLFTRLAAFTGGCDLAAAEAICADDQVRAGEILDVLSRLVDKSVVTGPGAGGEARFSQLQTLWQYGRDRLDESGEIDAMCARHGAYYRQMAEEAHEGLRGATGPMWRERLTSELGNLRALLERCRAAGQRGYVLFSLLRLAALRGRQGDDAAADGLYEEAIACSFDPSVSADAMVGQAAVARRLGDLARARALLDAAGSYYRNSDLPAGQIAVLAGLAWWALSAGQADDAMVFAADASQAASAGGDSAIQLLADTAVAAVKALTDPTRCNVEALVALAQQRAYNLPYRSLTSFTDEPDVAALAARLALPDRSAATRRRRPPRTGSAPS